MGMNVYLEAAGSLGYSKNATTAAATWVSIDGRSGKRLSILSYGTTTPSVATTIVFMQAAPGSGLNSLASALTASSTAIQWASARPSNIYTADYVAVKLDDGTFIYGSLNTTATTSTVLVSAGTMAAAAIGNPVYYFATAANAGHFPTVRGTALTQYTDYDAAGIGRFVATTMGSPMLVWIPAVAAGTALAGSIDYVTYGYISV
jgi:hypothetical protein